MEVRRDINGRRDIVGGSEGPNGQRAVLWRGGRIIDLGVLDGGVSSVAYAINDRGQVVGTSRTAAGELRGFLWQNGVMRDLGIDGGVMPLDINNRGQVVGSLDFGDSGARAQAFLWQDGVVMRLPAPGLTSAAIAVNDRSEVVGSYTAGDDEGSRAVRWYRETMIELGHLGKGNASGAADVNALGQIIGSANLMPHSMEEHPFLWWRGVMHDLDASGMAGELGSPAAINDRGQIVAGLMLYTPAWQANAGHATRRCVATPRGDRRR